MKRYYELLEIAEDAQIEEVKNAYRKRAKQCHPDVSNNPGSEEEFRLVQEAYENIMKHLNPNIEEIDFTFAVVDGETGEPVVAKINEQVIESWIDEFETMFSQGGSLFANSNNEKAQWEFNLPNGKSHSSKRKQEKLNKNVKKQLK